MQSNPRPKRSGGNVEGYAPVLLREEVKAALREFRNTQIQVPEEMRIERHMITAAVKYMLNTPEARESWLQMIRNEIRQEIDSYDVTSMVNA